MIKVTLFVGVIFAFAAAAVLSTPVESNIKEGCKSESELWGSVDGTKFYFCIGNNQSFEEACPPSTFFVNNATASGCIPFDKVESNCVYHSEPQPCEGIYLTQPQPHPDPNKFYFCEEKGAKPTLVDCGDKGAFIKQNGYMGCLEWTVWRAKRGCKLTD